MHMRVWMPNCVAYLTYITFYFIEIHQIFVGANLYRTSHHKNLPVAPGDDDSGCKAKCKPRGCIYHQFLIFCVRCLEWPAELFRPNKNSVSGGWHQNQFPWRGLDHAVILQKACILIVHVHALNAILWSCRCCWKRFSGRNLSLTVKLSGAAKRTNTTSK